MMPPHSRRFSDRNAIVFALLFFSFAMLAPGGSALAQGVADRAVGTAADKEQSTEKLQEAIDRLADIRQSLIERRQKLVDLKKALDAASEEETRKELQARFDALSGSIGELDASFEQIAIGGLDLGVFSKQPEKSFDWQHELIQITRPIFSSLNELTEKPRKIEDLRGRIERYQDQLEVAQEALDSLEAFQQRELPDIVREKLQTVVEHWQERKTETERALALARYQLDSLQGRDTSPLEATKAVVGEFLAGRGLTLGMALLVALVVWAVMWGLLWLSRKWPGRKDGKQRITRNRLLYYGFRALTGFVILLAVMAVFYLRGDLLLLAVSILGLAMLVLGLRQALPRYITETRLLLDLGPVRTGERVIYDGLPMQVKTINMYSVLRNPEIEGVVRLPLSALSELVSRPCGKEPWYPSRPGDYVLLPDGQFGQVLRQTLEMIQIKTAGSLAQFAVVDFLQLGARNLSREGFGLAVTFGIDYRHQSICLDQVPQRFHGAVMASLTSQGFVEEVGSVTVEFKEAGASSLDYLIYLTMQGGAAGAYFKLGRLVQQACVDVCNREGWGIPFAQLTLHQGEGFDALRAAPSAIAGG